MQLAAQPIAGRVVDVAGRPVAAASIEVAHVGLIVADDSGRFRLPAFDDTVVCRVRRIGFAPLVRAVAPPSPGDTVTFELRAVPALLRGLTVSGLPSPALAQTLTRSTIRQPPALFEPDVFRTAQLLPGVSQPNDLRGRVHLAGGTSDETGVQLDGHPLQDPFHLFGLLGAFNTAILERADVLVHHVPVDRADDHVGGLIDLRSRSPSDSGGEASLSLLTASATVATRPTGGIDVLASARTSYLTRIARLVLSDDLLRQGDVPLYDAADGTLRIGVGNAARWRAEVLGYLTEDRHDDPGFVGARGYDPLHWGERLLGFRSDGQLGRWHLRVHASTGAAFISMSETLAMPQMDSVRVRRGLVTMGASASRSVDGWLLTLGTDAQRSSIEQAWKTSERNDDIFSPRTPATFLGSEGLTRRSVVAVLMGGIGPATTGSIAARVWRVAGRNYLAPQTTLRRQVSECVAIEGAIERRHQFFAELEEPTEGTVGVPVFLLANPRIADIASAAIDWQPTVHGGVVDARLVGYQRWYRHHVALPPVLAGGVLTASALPGFVDGTARALGLGLLARGAFDNGLAFQASYTYSRARERIGGAWSPRAADQPHNLVSFVSLPLPWRKLLFTSALQVHSGPAITPVAARIFVIDNRNGEGLLTSRFLPGGRNSLRLAGYRRLDVGLKRSWHPSKAEVTLSAQMLNLLASTNPRAISWEGYFNGASARASGTPSLPPLPSIGVEVRW